jgi:hypothetical protein
VNRRQFGQSLAPLAIGGVASTIGGVALAQSANNISESATLYVTTDGNDSNTGLAWNTAKATIQAAIRALPSNGGLIEVGYGQFAGFSVVNLGGVHIRGRGIGRSLSNQDSSQTVPAHPTLITSNVLISASAANAAESTWCYGVILEDLAISNTNSSNAAGIGVSLMSPTAHFRRVSIEGCRSHGVYAPHDATGNPVVWFATWEKCRFIRNAGCGYYGAIVNGNFYDCDFDGNGSGNTAHAQLDLASVGGSGEVLFSGCVIQRAQGTSAGAILFGGTSLCCTSCHIEANNGCSSSAYGEIHVGSGAAHIAGTSFVAAAGTAPYAITSNQLSYVNVIGCFFFGDYWQYGAIQAWNGISGYYGNAIRGSLIGNHMGTLTNSYLLAGYQVPAWPAAASAGMLAGGPRVETVNPQNLTTPGSTVQIDAGLASVHALFLNASVAASSIINPTFGQMLTINWIQSTAGRSYAWPGNCRFANGSAPTPSTTKGYVDSVTFRCHYDGTAFSWLEASRAAAIH